jgi:hypothetical protein
MDMEYINCHLKCRPKIVISPMPAGVTRREPFISVWVLRPTYWGWVCLEKTIAGTDFYRTLVQVLR